MDAALAAVLSELAGVFTFKGGPKAFLRLRFHITPNISVLVRDNSVPALLKSAKRLGTGSRVK